MISKDDYILEKNFPLGCMIIRDDLYPFVGGGNKGRKALYYEEHMLKNGYNAIVTTGGVHSNHNRAMALLGAKHNWPCVLVVHGDPSRFKRESGNPTIIMGTDATIKYVEANSIGSSMDSAMENLMSRGFKPKYVTGGGHDLPGGIAYYEVAKQLLINLQKTNSLPKYIFLPCGTGSTMMGIAVASMSLGLNVEVIGISVAREATRATNICEEFARMMCEQLNVEYYTNYTILDDYLYGGYEQSSVEMRIWLRNQVKHSGILFDNTYSGKALWGMNEYVKYKGIDYKDVLFWHTGGIMNYIAQNSSL